MITVLEHFLLEAVRLAVAMDSQHVYDGLRGAVFKWHTAGWVGQSRLVCNVDLWSRALDLVDRGGASSAVQLFGRLAVLETHTL